MDKPQAPQQNHLLAAIQESEFARVLPQLELVHMPLGAVLYESGSAHFAGQQMVIRRLEDEY